MSLLELKERCSEVDEEGEQSLGDVGVQGSAAQVTSR